MAIVNCLLEGVGNLMQGTKSHYDICLGTLMTRDKTRQNNIHDGSPGML